MTDMFTARQAEEISAFKRGKLQRLNLWDGSVRSGKTWITVIIFALMVAMAPQSAPIIMIGKSLTALKRNVLDVLVGLVGESNFTYSLQAKEARLFGRKMYLEGANDARSEGKIRGLTLWLAYCDEVSLYPEDFFTMLLSRLSMPGAKLLATTNPDNPNHWLKVKYIDRINDPAPEKRIDMRLAHFLLDDNTTLPPEYVEALKREYTGVFHDRFIRGLWVAAEGVIYRQFADDKAAYIKALNKNALRDVMYVSIGVDFGGSRSLTTFVATAIHANFQRITVVADHHIKAPKGEIDADRLCREFVGFVQRLRTTYPWLYIKYVWADNEAQYLINSLRKAAQDAALGVEVHDCKKREIMDRIFATSTLLNTNRLLVGTDCTLVQGGLEAAVWDAKKPDTRLDNFSTDIDILDAFEYSWEPFLSRLCPHVKER